MKKLHLQSLLLMLCALTSLVGENHAQSHVSVSAGGDFATFQVLLDGKIKPFYDNETIKVGAATHFSLTGNYTYQPFLTASIANQGTEVNINAMAAVAAAGYVSYAIAEDAVISAALGYGAFANSEPLGISFDENGQPSNELIDYLGYGMYLDLAAAYKEFGVKFTGLNDLTQVFATYNVTEKLFVGLGYRDLKRVLISSNGGLPTVPSKFQATLGINWARLK